MKNPNHARLLLASLGVFLAACDSSTQPGIPSCEPGEGVQLQVGEVAELDGQGARIVCVTAGGDGGEYLLVAFAANPSSDQAIPLALRGDGLRPPGTAEVDSQPAPGVAREAAGEPGGLPGSTLEVRSDGPVRDLRFHGDLRRLERRELTERVGGTFGDRPAAVFEAIPMAGAPDPGDLVTLNTRTTDPCEDPRYRTGEVKAVSERAIVVADTLNPGGSGTFTDDHYRHFAAAFDTLVGPLGEANFGTMTDLSGNGRVTLFFTQDVNRLTGPGAGTFVGGFFFGRDLFPRDSIPGHRLDACAHSNETELLYLMVPDPEGTIGGNVRTLTFVERVTITTMVHELQHLINAAQRLYIIESQTPFEEVWLNEGLSHIAEEILFYHATGFSPGQNLGASHFPPGTRARELLNRYQIANTFRFEEFMEAPATNSPYNQEDLLPTRGATWHFLRYAADRRGGDQSALFRDLVASHSGGIQNLSDALASTATPLSRWFSDWSVALYADDRVPGVESRFRDPSWNHRSLFAGINEGAEDPFPLRVRSIEQGTVRSASLMGGGAAYFRFALHGGETGSVEITSGGGSPPAGLRVTVLRVD